MSESFFESHLYAKQHLRCVIKEDIIQEHIKRLKIRNDELNKK